MKREIKFCVAVLSTALVVSMAPVAVFADNGVSPGTTRTQSNQNAAAEQEKVETFAEAFPDEGLREIIRNQLSKNRRAFDEDGIEDELIISLDDNTKLTNELQEQLKNVKILDIDYMRLYEKTISPVNLESLSKYFTGVEYLRTCLYTNYINWDAYKDMLVKMKNLKYLKMDENDGAKSRSYDAKVRVYDFPSLNNLEALDFHGSNVDRFEVSNLTNLKQLSVDVLNNYKGDVKNIDFTNNKKIESIYISGDISDITLGNQKLKKLTIYSSDLACVDIPGEIAKDADVSIKNNWRKEIITDKEAFVDMSKIPKFKAANVVKDSVINATFKDNKFYIKDTSQYVKYKYKCTDSVIGEFRIIPLVMRPILVKKGQTEVNPKYVASCFLNKDIFPKEMNDYNDIDFNKFEVNVLNKIPKEPKVNDDGMLYLTATYYEKNGKYGYGYNIRAPYVFINGIQPTSGETTENTINIGSAPTVTGIWRKDFNGKWMYIIDDNKYVMNAVVKINGKIYSFDKDGIMKTGWEKKDSTWYYFNQKGNGTEGALAINEWKKVRNNWYYFDKYGKMVTGWLKDNGSWYYLNEKDNGIEGVMASNQWKKVNGKWYYFYGSGRMVSDTWKKVDGKWYYFNGSGKMVSNAWKKVDGKWYYFYGSGKMAQNTWEKLSGRWYYFYGSGEMASSTWKKVSGKWYYFYDRGHMASDTWAKLNGKWYYFYGSGEMVSNTWKKVSGKWYYFYESGKMVSNTWKKVSGKWYYFYNNGEMAANTVVNGYKLNASGAWVR